MVYLPERPEDLTALGEADRSEASLWHLGLSLVAADLLGVPFRRVADAGGAAGAFSGWCQAFGATFQDIADSSGPHHLVTLWDRLTTLPNPRPYLEAIAEQWKHPGVACFSTPNGEALNAMPTPELWDGFADSFERLFYLSHAGVRELFKGLAAEVFLYPLHRDGEDVILGIASRHPVSVRTRELLVALFENPRHLVSAAEKGELGVNGVCGLIILYLLKQRLGEAKQLAQLLPRLKADLPAGIVDLLTGWVEAGLGHFQQADALVRHACRQPALAEVEAAARMQLLRLAFEERGRALEQLRMTAQAQRQELHRLQHAFDDYRLDKEKYVSHLRAQLDELAWAQRVKHLPGKVKGKLKKLASRVMPPPLKRRWQALNYEGLTLQPHGKAVLYAPADLYPSYAPRVEPPADVDTRNLRVTLITTVRNEGASIDVWLKGILDQTRLPDELVVVDAGSTDDTLERLERFKQTSPFPVKVLVSPGAKIAHGRNQAIREARHEIIACTDLGCHPDRHWLERMLVPFVLEPKTEVVAGWTEAHATTPFQRALAYLTVPPQGSVDPQTYLPSSRTMAFTRDAWQRVGGYPEWLTFAGEDTFFALLLKNRCAHWAFVPTAVIYWHMRTTWKAVYRQAYLYGMGDGEAALFPLNYKRDGRHLAVLGVAGAMMLSTLIMAVASMWQAVLAAGLIGAAFVAFWAVRKSRRLAQFYLSGLGGQERRLAFWMLWVIVFARTMGFLKGVAGRVQIHRKRFASTQATCVIFSGVPIHDSGGGQRATQLALEFLERGYRVVFLNQYPSYESRELHLPLQHPHLELNTVEAFDPRTFLATHDPVKPLVAIAEFPHPAFLPALNALKAAGGKIVYDLIDDWRSSLGSDWYSTETERRYYDLSDLLVASAQTLADRLATESRREVALVPNAVNLRLFRRGEYSRPLDMVTGRPTITYVGALWGEWFDWEQLIALAEAYPQSSVVVIGDYRGQCPKMLPNLHFLGLKPQRELPAYLAHSDVAIIPFKISDLTQAVSPLKVFEYLAMGVPVVSTPLRELEGMPYVFTGATHQDFCDQVVKAAETEVDPVVIQRFIAANSWGERVDRILSGIGLRSADETSLADVRGVMKAL